MLISVSSELFDRILGGRATGVNHNRRLHSRMRRSHSRFASAARQIEALRRFVIVCSNSGVNLRQDAALASLAYPAASLILCRSSLLLIIINQRPYKASGGSPINAMVSVGVYDVRLGNTRKIILHLHCVRLAPSGVILPGDCLLFASIRQAFAPLGFVLCQDWPDIARALLLHCQAWR